jgi:hypothetical protein
VIVVAVAELVLDNDMLPGRVPEQEVAIELADRNFRLTSKLEVTKPEARRKETQIGRLCEPGSEVACLVRPHCLHFKIDHCASAPVIDPFTRRSALAHTAVPS